MEERLKTGTTTVGIYCKDGIVLAADRRATAGTMIVDKKAEKVHLIWDDYALTLAGSVSDAQLLIKILKAEIKLKEVRTGKRVSVKEVANQLAGLQYSGIRSMSFYPAIAHFLLAGRDSEGLHLYDLFPDGSVTKVRDYVSSGSGSVFAYGVLETQYTADLSVSEGVKLAVKAVNAALQRDSATGNGIDVLLVTEKEIKRVMEKELVYSL
ncbi:proteasome subunit beta [Candidatus Woesearchaeota archaeon]|nr:proteasome subunit beta [Candidatus Woesearchaeota archaeon]